MNYKYKRINVPEEIIIEARKKMLFIGCRTMTTFVSIAMKDALKKIDAERKGQLEKPDK